MPLVFVEASQEEKLHVQQLLHLLYWNEVAYLYPVSKKADSASERRMNLVVLYHYLFLAFEAVDPSSPCQEVKIKDQKKVVVVGHLMSPQRKKLLSLYLRLQLHDLYTGLRHPFSSAKERKERS